MLRALAKRALIPLWWLLRPFVRPLLWRGRTFLLGPAMEELDRLRGLDERLLVAITGSEANLKEVLAQNTAILRESRAVLADHTVILRESRAVLAEHAAILQESRTFLAESAAILRESRAAIEQSTAGLTAVNASILAGQLKSAALAEEVNRNLDAAVVASVLGTRGQPRPNG